MFMKIDDLKKHYLFTKADEENLKKAAEIIFSFEDELANDFYEYLAANPEIAPFFRTAEAIEGRKTSIKEWLKNLLSGTYNNRYIQKLEQIGRTHVKRDIPIHWVTASMNFKRQYLLDILEKEVSNAEEYSELSRSLNKILDINLDVLSSTYHEEEIRRRFLTARMDSALILFAERFTYGINIVLVLALIGLSLSIIGLFASEVYSLFTNLTGFETKVLTALGTLLIIWVMIELMSTEIKYLKGERFHIEIFVSVALVAFIRELLIASLAGEATAKLVLLLSAILILGVVYFLISRTEGR
jgi:uncharacterized membrane protein (DUF373 family)